MTPVREPCARGQPNTKKGRKWLGPQTQQEVVTYVRSQAFTENLHKYCFQIRLGRRLNISALSHIAEEQIVVKRAASCTARQPLA